jgi:HK97 family phage major capsid protein/HK97 family phage prohead protease
MPLTPHKDEKEDAFMSRCMTELGKSDTSRPQKQKVAICMNAWRDAKGGKAPPKKNIENITPGDDEDEEDFLDRCVNEEGYDEDECQMVWDERKANVPVQKTYISDGTGYDYVISDESIDRLGDVVEASGWEFKSFASGNPIALFNHDKNAPIGRWENLRVERGALRGKLVLADAGTSPRIDEIRSLVEQGILRAVSVGFLPLKHVQMERGMGRRYKQQELLEASLVSVAANKNALRVAKSLGVSDETQKLVFKQDSEPAGAHRIVKLQEARMAKKSIADQIAGFESTRSSKHAKMTEIMDAATEKGETLDAEQKTEYDDLAAEVKSVDEHLDRLRLLEKTNVQKAVEVNGKDLAAAAQSRNGNGGGEVVRISTRRNLYPAATFTRHFICRAVAFLEHKTVYDVAKERGFYDQTPELETIQKAPVAVGTTTATNWALPLVEPQFMAAEFIELLQPLTIIGRVPGFRRVPFNIKIPRQTTAASVSWVGQGAAKPVSALAFDSITLGFTKVAGIVPVTEELFRFSNPAVETLIRDSLLNAVAQLTDFDFLDPTKIAVTGISPASITNGVVAHTASGTTADALRSDLGHMLGAYAATNQSLAGLVLIMKSQRAIRISLMRTSLGTREFEGLGPSGGSLEGIPVIVSENMYSSGSPAGDMIVAVNAPEVLVADDGQVSVDISREASLQMDSAPDSPPTATTVMQSLWQLNLVGIRCERGLNWIKRRATAVQYIEGANYA